MKQALKVIEEINYYKEIVKKTNNIFIQKDYSKKIKELINDLKEYCFYKKDINYENLMKLIKK